MDGLITKRMVRLLRERGCKRNCQAREFCFLPLDEKIREVGVCGGGKAGGGGDWVLCIYIYTYLDI